MANNRKKAYLDYLSSDKWAIIRCDMIQLYNSICSRCNRKTDKPFIHHLTYDNIFHEEPEDLTLLCGRCHKWIHGLLKKKKRKKKHKKKKVAIWKYV